MVWNKSFTLIELLVVIAIIGLLASVVLVSMVGLKNKARITKALETSQSIHHALGAYAVGIWDFDDQINPTKDGSGYNNNGTLNNFVPPNGYVDDTPHKAAGRGAGKYALSFDGVDDYVSIADSVSLRPAVFTITAWVNPNNLVPTGQVGVVSKFNYSPYRGYGIELSNGSYITRIGIGGSSNDFGFGPAILNQWQFIVFSYDGINQRGYINGIQTHSSALTGSILHDTTALLIGRQVISPVYFNGLIDEVRIYDKALTLSEVRKMYAEGLESHKDLVIK